MKRFTFSLDRVRAWRQEQVEVEEMRLANLHSALRALGEERAGILAQRREAETSVDRGCPADMIQLAQFRQHLNQREQAIVQREKEHLANVEAQRVRLLEARRQHELLHQLRQRDFASWRAAVDKDQEDLAAELFLARHRRA